MIRVGSLCSGIGAIDLGLERAGGYTITYQVEINPYCRRILAKHWPDVPKYEDLTQIQPGKLPQVDLITAGFPCQPHSVAGKQKGTSDERWIWPDIWRIVRYVGCAVLLENVPNLLRVNNGRAFGEILSDMAADGYDATWDVLPASHTGAPHHRERLWLVAYPNSQRLERRRLLSKRTSERLVGPSRLGSSHIGDVFRGTIGGNWPTETDAGVQRVSFGTPNRIQRLQSIGNSCCVPLVTWIGQRIQESYTISR